MTIFEFLIKEKKLIFEIENNLSTKIMEQKIFNQLHSQNFQNFIIQKDILEIMNQCFENLKSTIKNEDKEKINFQNSKNFNSLDVEISSKINIFIFNIFKRSYQ